NVFCETARVVSVCGDKMVEPIFVLRAHLSAVGRKGLYGCVGTRPKCLACFVSTPGSSSLSQDRLGSGPFSRCGICEVEKLIGDKPDVLDWLTPAKHEDGGTHAGSRVGVLRQGHDGIHPELVEQPLA